jgi:hypothetical protein
LPDSVVTMGRLTKRQSARITAGMRARITLADVTLGNKLVVESLVVSQSGLQLAHLTALLCPCRQQTLKRTYQRRFARTQSGRRARRKCS